VNAHVLASALSIAYGESDYFAVWRPHGILNPAMRQNTLFNAVCVGYDELGFAFTVALRETEARAVALKSDV
jgi:hypothetical protein